MGVNLGRTSRPPLCHPWDLCRCDNFYARLSNDVRHPKQTRIARKYYTSITQNKYYTDNRRRKDATEGSSLRGITMLTLLYSYLLACFTRSF